MTTTVHPNRAPLAATNAARDHRPVLRRLAAETQYLLAAWPLTVAAAVMVMVLASIGAGLAVLVIGVPVLAATLLASRRFAEAERRQLRRLMQVSIPAASYHGSSGGLLLRSAIALTDPQRWRDALYCAVQWIVTTVTVSIAVSWWAAAVGGLTWAAWGWALPQGPDEHDLPWLIGLGNSYLMSVAFYPVAGLIFAVSLPRVIRSLSGVTAALARTMVSPTQPQRWSP